MTLSRAVVATSPTAFVVVVVVMVSVLALAATYGPQGASISSTNTTRTCTDVPAISYLYCPSPLRITAYGEPGATPVGNWTYQGTWNFTVSINSDYVARDDPILLSANLTNIGSNYTANQFVLPYINPGVYTSSGTLIWAWDPPAATFLNYTIAAGETLSQHVNIPTSQLTPGQSYFISVAPISIQFPAPNNLTFTFQFSVH